MPSFLFSSHGNTMIFPLLGETYNGSLINFFNKELSPDDKFTITDETDKELNDKIRSVIKEIDLQEVENYFQEYLNEFSQVLGGHVKYTVKIYKRFPFELSVKIRFPSYVHIIGLCNMQSCKTNYNQMLNLLKHEKFETHMMPNSESDVFKGFCRFENEIYDMVLSDENVGNYSDLYKHGLFPLPYMEDKYISIGKINKRLETYIGADNLNSFRGFLTYLNILFVKNEFRMTSLSILISVLCERRKRDRENGDISIILNSCRNIIDANVNESRYKEKLEPFYLVTPKSPVRRRSPRRSNRTSPPTTRSKSRN